METAPKITVFGSLNGDIFMKVKNLPKAGETIACSEITKASGGKGANQAGACARLGAEVTFLCQVGKDEIGQMVLNELGEAGVNVSKVKALEGVASGQAYIFSLPGGENSIVIHGGANTAWDEKLTELDPDFVSAIKESKILLLQREIPEHVNILAAKIAKESNVAVILDAGGMDISISSELLDLVDIFSPNETELERIMEDLYNKEYSLTANALLLMEKHSNLSILLKLGSKGSAFIDKNDKKISLAPAVTDHKSKEIIDTTGAGDCFTAAFAVKLSEGVEITKAMEYANTAAFLCITKYGALPAMPFALEVTQFIQ